MATERRNPLPSGYYWVDVPGSKVEAFTQWLKRNASQVKVTETRELDSESLGETITQYLFRVLEPVSWEGPGFPTIASEGTRLDETVQRPDPEPEVIDQVLDTVKSGRGILWLAGAGIAALVAWKLKSK